MSVIEMAPIGSPHAGCVNKLNELFVRRADRRAIVSVQHALIISGLSVPEPDLALLKTRADYYTESHPTSSDVLLVVEVADTTLAFDLASRAKRRMRGASRSRHRGRGAFPRLIRATTRS